MHYEPSFSLGKTGFRSQRIAKVSSPSRKATPRRVKAAKAKAIKVRKFIRVREYITTDVNPIEAYTKATGTTFITGRILPDNEPKKAKVSPSTVALYPPSYSIPVLKIRGDDSKVWVQCLMREQAILSPATMPESFSPTSAERRVKRFRNRRKRQRFNRKLYAVS